jgi:hypothetical protein
MLGVGGVQCSATCGFKNIGPDKNAKHLSDSQGYPHAGMWEKGCGEKTMI